MKPLFLFIQHKRLVEEVASRQPPPELIPDMNDLDGIANQLKQGYGVYFLRKGDSTDNRLGNLVYLPASYHGHITHRGENAHKARLTEIQVREVRNLLAKGYTQKRIALQYGVARSTIGEIKRGASWEWFT